MSIFRDLLQLFKEYRDQNNPDTDSSLLFKEKRTRITARMFSWLCLSVLIVFAGLFLIKAPWGQISTPILLAAAQGFLMALCLLWWVQVVQNRPGVLLSIWVTTPLMLLLCVIPLPGLTLSLTAMPPNLSFYATVQILTAALMLALSAFWLRVDYPELKHPLARLRYAYWYSSMQNLLKMAKKLGWKISEPDVFSPDMLIEGRWRNQQSGILLERDWVAGNLYRVTRLSAYVGSESLLWRMRLKTMEKNNPEHGWFSVEYSAPENTPSSTSNTFQKTMDPAFSTRPRFLPPNARLWTNETGLAYSYECRGRLLVDEAYLQELLNWLSQIVSKFELNGYAVARTSGEAENPPAEQTVSAG